MRVRGVGVRARSRSGTPRALLARLGRVVLWVAVAVVLARGLAGVLASDPQRASSRVVRAAPVWPDEAARAFAIEFAAAYLTVDPDDDSGVRAELAELAAPEIADRLIAQLDVDTARQSVLSVNPAGATRLDDGHALITVAVRVSGKQ